jgi:transient receptor potential cation channel subfamily A protein 1
MVGRHPRLTTINIYVTMLYRVLGTFILFLTWYSLFILAFGLGFYILLHQDLTENPEVESDYKFFDTLGLCIVKTFTMFVGELEFGDLPIDSAFGYIFLLAFVFLIVVVLMNLLNGLAVSDTGVIRAEAEIHAYKTQVSRCYCLLT